MSTPAEAAAALRELRLPYNDASLVEKAASLLDRLAAAEAVCEAARDVTDRLNPNVPWSEWLLELHDRLVAWEALRGRV